jgi:hypothetical protein
MQTRTILTVILCLLVGNSVAAERGIPPQLQRPPDMAIERLDRPERPPARSPDGRNQTALTQAEAVKLAKTAAKQEKDKKVDEYDLKSVTFDPTNREWTVSFDPKPPRRASEECFLVTVKDETKETNVLRC